MGGEGGDLGMNRAEEGGGAGEAGGGGSALSEDVGPLAPAQADLPGGLPTHEPTAGKRLLADGSASRHTSRYRGVTRHRRTGKWEGHVRTAASTAGSCSLISPPSFPALPAPLPGGLPRAFRAVLN